MPSLTQTVPQVAHTGKAVESHTEPTTIKVLTPAEFDKRPSVPPGTPLRETSSIADTKKRVGMVEDAAPVVAPPVKTKGK